MAENKLKKWAPRFLWYALFCCFAVLIDSNLEVSDLIYPIFNVVLAILMLLFFIFVLPLSPINKVRTFLVQFTTVLSFVCRSALSIFSFLMILKFLGWKLLIASVILVAFSTLLVALSWISVRIPAIELIATIGLLLNGEWLISVSIVLMMALGYGLLWLKDIYIREEVMEAFKEFRKRYPPQVSEIIEEEIEAYICFEPHDLAHTIQGFKRSARELVYRQIGKRTRDFLESNLHNLYRSELDPMEICEELLKVFDTTCDELVKMKAVDQEYADEQKMAIRKNIERLE